MAKTVPDLILTRLRLRIARIKAGYLTLTAAEKYVEECGITSQRSYRGYEHGWRPLPLKHVEALERAFKTVPGYLSKGRGESQEALERELAELERQARAEIREGGWKAPPPVKGKRPALVVVNQLTSDQPELDINPSQLVPVSRIPVLLADEIASFLAGDWDSAMAGATLPVSDDLLAEGRIFAFAVEKSDESMIGTGGDSFPPGTMLIFNADADVPPAKYMLVRRRGMKRWLFRRYEAALPFSEATEYTLRALNPAVEAIRVTDRQNWECGGLLIAAQHRY
jgi:SOS-response transcriptional repressor LexA